MIERFAVGIDVGATNFRLGVVSEDGRILSKHMAVVGQARRPKDIAFLLKRHLDELSMEYPNIIGVGAGIPGIVDHKSGVVYKSPHYLEWVDAHFKKIFEDAFRMSVVLDNDANMAALGEGWMGAAKGLENYVMVTLGTGVGGGIVVDGQLWHGDMGFAGEIGHMVLDFGGRPCPCGGRGCFEMYASASGLSNLIANTKDADRKRLASAVGSDFSRVTPELLYELARDGDIFSSVIWKKFGAYLGAGLASVVNVTGIFNVVIGGGIVRAWDFFIGEAEKEFRKRIYKETASHVKLLRAELLDDAGILGAAREVFVIDSPKS